MPIVENFLCFDLSTGGYAIGSFELFLQAVLIFFTGYQLTHSLAHATVELIMLIGEISIYSLSILTAVFLIAGTSRRDVRMIFPFLVTTVLVLIVIIVNLVTLHWQFVPFAIYTIYSFICILSLCQQIREEKVRKTVNNYQPTPTQE